MRRSKIAVGFFWAMARLGGLTLALHMLALAMAPGAQAQGSRKDDIVFNSRGVPLAGATVRVCAMPASGQPCTPLAQIFSDAALTQALANPTTTDGLGNYFFYAAPGKYEIEFSGPGITTKQIPNVILPSDPTSPNFSSVSSSGGISAFSLNLTGNLTVNGNTTVVGNLASGTLNLANQSTAPGAAGTGTVNLYTKTADKRLYYKDDTGTEIGPVGAVTGVATQPGNNAFTGNNTHSGTETFTGTSVVFCRIENIRFVDAVNGCGWTGSDIGAWINSAISDLPSTGGKIVVGVTGNANFAAQVAPAKTVIIEGLGASYQNAGAHCITTLTWTGGASAPFIFSGAAAQGSRLAQMCLNATGTAPPVFVDIDAAAGKVELDHVVVDTPTVQATVAAFRWGNTGSVVDQRCTDTFVRSAAPIGYDLLSLSGHFVGTDCRSLQNTTNEWVIGGTNPVQSFHCYGCTAEHTNAGGTAAVLINNAIASNWDSGYFECGGATNSWCVDIPNTATLAQVVNISNSHAGGGAATGTNAFLHVNLATAVVNIFNNRIGDSIFAVGSAIVKNDAAKRVTLVGNNQSAVSAVEYTTSSGVYALGNTVGGVLTSISIPGSTSGESILQPPATGGVTNTLPSIAGTLPAVISNGTATLGTSAIAATNCASVVTVSATGVATTDTITFALNATASGYTSATGSGLTILAVPTSGNVNFYVCNPTAGSITPAAATLNWRVMR